MGNRSKYSDEFRREAVRLVTEEGFTKKRAAEAVGVSAATLASWVAQQDAAAPRTRFASEVDELEHLRKENARLRMERDFLKKAAAFFAKEEGRS